MNYDCAAYLYIRLRDEGDGAEMMIDVMDAVV